MWWEKLQSFCQARVKDFYCGSPNEEDFAKGAVAVFHAKGCQLPFGKCGHGGFSLRSGGKFSVCIDALIADQGFTESFKGVFLVFVKLLSCHFVFPSFFGSIYITNELGAISRKNRKLPKSLHKIPLFPMLCRYARIETNPNSSRMLEPILWIIPKSGPSWDKKARPHF